MGNICSSSCLDMKDKEVIIKTNNNGHVEYIESPKADIKSPKKKIKSPKKI